MVSERGTYKDVAKIESGGRRHRHGRWEDYGGS